MTRWFVTRIFLPAKQSKKNNGMYLSYQVANCLICRVRYTFSCLYPDAYCMYYGTAGCRCIGADLNLCTNIVHRASTTPPHATLAASSNALSVDHFMQCIHSSIHIVELASWNPSRLLACLTTPSLSLSVGMHTSLLPPNTDGLYKSI